MKDVLFTVVPWRKYDRTSSSRYDGQSKAFLAGRFLRASAGRQVFVQSALGFHTWEAFPVLHTVPTELVYIIYLIRTIQNLRIRGFVFRKNGLYWGNRQVTTRAVPIWCRQVWRSTPLAAPGLPQPQRQTRWRQGCSRFFVRLPGYQPR